MGKSVNQKKQNFVFGAMLLMISGILCKVIGACFKIPLQYMIDDDGMGYYSSAYSIYNVLFMISTSGIPVAVSRIIASYIVKKDGAAVKKTFRISTAILLVLGFLGSALMFFFAGPISENILKSPDSKYAIMALAPTLLFICLESSLRGYFQGHQNMTPTSVSQIIESFGKLLIGLGAAVYAQKAGLPLPVVAAYAILGIGIGAAFSCIYLIVYKLAYRSFDYGVCENSPSSAQIAKELILIAVPITLSSLVLSIAGLVDSMTIMRRLQESGLTLETAKNILADYPAQYFLSQMTDQGILESAANILYGNYTTLAVTYYNLPLVLLTPISVSMLPAISEAFTKGSKKQIDDIIDSAFRIQSAVALPCAAGLCILSGPALSVLYRSKLSVDRAAPLLSILSISIFFVAMVSITNSVLHSMHRQWLPIISMAAGTAVKIVVAYILIGIPQIGIYGAPISTTACYLTAMLFNFYFMSKYAGCKPSIRKVFAKPLLSAMVCAFSAYAAYVFFEAFLSVRLSAIAAIAVAAMIYVVFVCRSGAITKDDILLLPKGKAVYGILLKLRLVKE